MATGRLWKRLARGSVQTTDDTTQTTILTITSALLPVNFCGMMRVVLCGFDGDWAEPFDAGFGAWQAFALTISDGTAVDNVSAFTALAEFGQSVASTLQTPLLTKDTPGNDLLIQVTSGDDKAVWWGIRAEIRGLEVTQP